ncbi:MAG: hypothetical protein GWN08_09545, partial [Gemmatimonadetes bacterium]|nr:hypothetical protein [Gemmatimonadota bacterium]NIW75474.1 hypothetical protein [Gemmatimonadota bacterium]
RRVTDAVSGLSGVDRVQPQVLSRDVRVAYDARMTDEEAIAGQVRALGYTVEREGQEPEHGHHRVEVWTSPEAWRSYVAGAFLGAGLLVRLAGLSPVLWTGLTWRLDVGAALFVLGALVGGWNFFPKGLRAARIARLDMNFLMTVAIFGALGIGEFVEAASIAFLFGIAELLESYSVARARRSLRELVDLAPATARLRRDG